MRITAKKPVEQEVTVGYRCDVCQKEEQPVWVDKNWVTLSICHGNWPDAHEHFDVCSPACYIVQVRRCVEDKVYEIDEKPLAFMRALLEHFK